MTALNKEEFTDVIRDSSEEFDCNLKLLTSKHLSFHCRALDETGAADSSEVDVEFKWNFADVLDKEIFLRTLVKWNSVKVKFFGRQAVRDKV